MIDRVPEALFDYRRRLAEYAPDPRAYVYFLLSAGEIIYVGQTRNLPARIRTHRLRFVFDRVLYLIEPSPFEARRTEAELIWNLKPRLNVVGNLRIRVKAGVNVTRPRRPIDDVMARLREQWRNEPAPGEAP